MSKLISKFLNLPSAERELLIKALLLEGAMRTGLWLLPFPILQKLVLRLAAKPAEDRAKMVSADDLAWAITTASRFVPKATCLTQAMAAKILFGIHGYESLLKIGVARGEDGRMRAHAWLESQGRAVVGGPECEYTPLLSME
jgi:hypothetical protein